MLLRGSRPRSASAEDILSPTWRERIESDEQFNATVFNYQDIYDPCSECDGNESNLLGNGVVILPAYENVPAVAVTSQNEQYQSRESLNPYGHNSTRSNKKHFLDIPGSPTRPRSSTGFTQDAFSNSFSQAIIENTHRSKSTQGLNNTVIEMHRSISVQSFQSEYTGQVSIQDDEYDQEHSLSGSPSHVSFMSDELDGTHHESDSSRAAIFYLTDDELDEPAATGETTETSYCSSDNRPSTPQSKIRRCGQTQPPNISERPYFPEVDGSFTHWNNNLLHPFHNSNEPMSLSNASFQPKDDHSRRASDLPGFSARSSGSQAPDALRSSSSCCLARRVLITQHWIQQFKTPQIEQVYLKQPYLPSECLDCFPIAL